jgi:hypothetical protein
MASEMNDRDHWNGCRFQSGDAGGHYESWFQRANHPDLPLAFWIRYTIFCPKGRPQDAVGELWAVYFDGETRRITAVKQVMPIAECGFASRGLDHHIGNAILNGGMLRGAAQGQGRTIGWDLAYTSPEDPLLLLPERLYTAPFPKAKGLVGSPLAAFSGELMIDGRSIKIDDWIGSQNHNWGSKHTDRYAWGQVAGFDDEPEAFLEVATARVRLGPVWTPRMTLMVLRIDGEELRLNSLPQSIRASAGYDLFSWHFKSASRMGSISGNIEAPADAFVGLPYGNPPGGQKTCLNSKLASCRLTVRRPGSAPRSLVSTHRAAFEILTDRSDHGVPVLPT